MIAFEEALRVVLSRSSPLGREKVSLQSASGRVLFRDVSAPEEFPPFDSSSTDGFAVRWTDVSEVSLGGTSELKVVGEASAGHLYKNRVAPGEAVRIMTGAEVPLDADTVIPFEETESFGKNRIRVMRVQRKGSHIRAAGSDARSGEIVLQAGSRIAPPHLGLLASLGFSRISVHKRPIVRVVPTGDELVRIDRAPKRGKIRAGNSFTLAGYINDAGGMAEILGILPDRRKRLRKGIRNALPADILLTIGGVSTGKYDLVRRALEDLGARILFHQVNIKPGRPLVFAILDDTLVFGLPGNPASAVVAFLQFVRPAVWRMSGQVQRRPLEARGILEHPLKKSDDRRHFLRGRAWEEGGSIRVATTGSQSSSSVRSLVLANCLIVLPERITHLRKGDEVGIEWL
jgi:molybdopterin molybdotransferase